MKKTISVHIKGMNFLLEEDAYTLLSNYLNLLNKSLLNEAGAKEIAEDIELRIAELCSLKLSDRKQVIELEDIQEILDTLGDPRQFVDDSADQTTSNEVNDGYENNTEDKSSYKQATNEQSSDRRLFRDIANAKIAGVCSGLANYFNIDVVFIRILFVVFLIFAGFGFPLYVILWIVVPKTANTIDRLRMKGAPINVETVREEVEHAAHRFEKNAKRFSDKLRNSDDNRSYLNNVVSLIKRAMGIFLILVGFGFLIAFLVFIVGGLDFIPIDSNNGFISLRELGELFFAEPLDLQLAWIGGIVTATAIILQIITAGTTLLFNIKSRWTRIVQILFTLTYIFSGALCVFVGIGTGRDFAIESEIERKVGAFKGTTLTILTAKPAKADHTFQVKSTQNFGFIGVNGNTIENHGIHVIYRESEDSLYHIYQNFSANGKNNKRALVKAKNISNAIELNGPVLQLSSLVSFPKRDKLRDQEVTILIEIPKNGIVLINKQVIRLGAEVESENGEQTEQEGELQSNSNYYHWD